MNPSLFGQGLAYPDGSVHASRDITHELGHALGHADYFDCSTPTLMDTTESCLYNEPQDLDISNYHKAYHADAVSAFSAFSTSAHRVTLIWDPDNIHNERAFLINWRNQCTGQWQILETSGKNTASTTLTGQQGGPQDYQIVPLTYADATHGFAGDASPPETATVGSLLSAPIGLTSSFPTISSGLMTWSAVSAADHYHVRTDFTPTGSFAPTCWPSTTETQFTTAVPTQHLVQVYNKVMACTSGDLCSPMSEWFTLNERVDNSSWDYAFTYYRTGDEIKFQFINFNPNLMALRLHVRNGSGTNNPPLADTSQCIPVNTVSAVDTYAAASFTSSTLGTQGHDILNAGACDTTHNDNATIGWGTIPGLIPSAGVGGVVEPPEVAGPPLQTGGSAGRGAGILAGIAAAVAAGAVVLGGAAWYARRR